MKSTHIATLLVWISVSFTVAQQVGTATSETHPKLSVATCSNFAGCITQQASVVLDSNWRWLHSTGNYTNCYSGNKWDSTLCPDGRTCALNCAIEGVGTSSDYATTFGISTSGNQLKLNFATQTSWGGVSYGNRVFLMETDTKYQLFKLKNMEFRFDVDVSQLGCGLNGALYFVEMDADGGMSKYSTNKAGAKYGTGYCDAKCSRDLKFIIGEANVEEWTGVDSDVGVGKYGSCCTELDIWEANSFSTAMTIHPCSNQGSYRCTSATDCASTCDKDGCDFNPYRMGDTSFYGKGLKVDTSKPFTVVTQFITNDGTANGDLVEIRRIYVQNGRVIPNAASTFDNLSGGPYNSITDKFCLSQKTLFNEPKTYGKLGGLKAIGDALGRGMVLVMAVSEDYDRNMLWLDSKYPPLSEPGPGVNRGNCATSTGNPNVVRQNQMSDFVKFSNIQWGSIQTVPSPILSQSQSMSTPTITSLVLTSPYPAISPSPSSSPLVACGGQEVSLNGQCGGKYYTGINCCVSGTICKVMSEYYSQCVSNKSSPVPNCSPKPNCKPRYAQCGGSTYQGVTCCESGSKCTVVSEWYSQCK